MSLVYDQPHRHPVGGVWRRIRRYVHRHGVELFLVGLVVLALAAVVGLMYVMTNPAWRPRY